MEKKKPVTSALPVQQQAEKVGCDLAALYLDNFTPYRKYQDVFTIPAAILCIRAGK